MSARECKIIICSYRIAADISSPEPLADLRALATLAAMATPPPGPWLDTAVEILNAYPRAEPKLFESWAMKLAAHLDELFSGT